MNQTTIRLEPNLKKDFANVCDDLGLSVSTAITIFAKTVVRERRIPFSVTADPFYSEVNQTRLRRAIADMDAGINVAEHELIEVDDD